MVLAAPPDSNESTSVHHLLKQHGVVELASGNPQGPHLNLCPHPCQVPYKLEITAHITITMGSFKQLAFMSTFKT